MAVQESIYVFDQINLGKVSNLEDLDFKVLAFQNKKLFERLEYYRSLENSLKHKVEQYESKFHIHESVMCIINRYWNILDENLKICIDRLALESNVQKTKSLDEITTQKFKEIDENTDIDLVKFKINLKRKCLESSSEDHSDDEKHKKHTDTSDDSERDFNKYGKLAKIRKMQDLSKKKAIKEKQTKDDLFDLKEPEYNMFVEELFTDDRNVLDSKLNERVEFTKNTITNIIKSLEIYYAMRDEALNKIDEIKNFPPFIDDEDKLKPIINVVKHLKLENENIRNLNISFQNRFYKEQMIKKEIKDKLKLSRNLNEELQNKLDEFEYENGVRISKEIKLNGELVQQTDKYRRLEIELINCKRSLAEAVSSASSAAAATAAATTTMVTNSTTHNNLTTVQIPLTFAGDLDLGYVKEMPTSTTSNTIPIQDAYKILEFELQQEREISGNRLTELEKMHSQYIDALSRIEKLQQFKDRFVRTVNPPNSGVSSINPLLLPPNNTNEDTNSNHSYPPSVLASSGTVPATTSLNPGIGCCEISLDVNSTTVLSAAASALLLDFDEENFNEHHYIVNSDEYKTLHCQFVVLYNDNKQLKYQCEELRKLLHSVKAVYLKQMEDLSLIQQENCNRFMEDAKNLQDNWFRAKKELDILRIEHEQFVSTREQSSALNQETKITIANLQEHNRQLKREIMRWKKKLAYTHAPTNSQSHGGATPVLQRASYPPPENNAAPAPTQSFSPSKRNNSEPNIIHLKQTSQLPHHLLPRHEDMKDQLTLDSKIVSENKDTNFSKNEKRNQQDQQQEMIEQKLEIVEDRNKIVTNEVALQQDSKIFTAVPAYQVKKIETFEKKFDAVSASSSFSKLPSQDQHHQATTNKTNFKLSNFSETTFMELKEELKRSVAAQKELKILLEVYKNVSKDQREKAEMLGHEKKLSLENTELKEKIRHLEQSLVVATQQHASTQPQGPLPGKENNNEAHGVIENVGDKSCLESGSTSTSQQGGTLLYQHQQQQLQNDLTKKLAICEERLASLQKRLFDTKQEEEALLKELEVTGQAFEDMQEQNIRLLQQLREKDDANFKLMTERIKANQMTKLIKDEKDYQAGREDTLKQANQKLNELINAYKEKEKILQNALQSNERESRLRMMSCDMYRTKTTETLNALALVKEKSEHLSSKLQETHQRVEEKNTALEKEHFRCSRLKEELGRLKDKLKYLKQKQQSNNENAAVTLDDQTSAANAAEIMLLTEEIRSYKELMTCPSCKSNRKDAMLSKCYHVFCYRCLKTRYDTRRRKCPECAAPFGANDFHRLFLY